MAAVKSIEIVANANLAAGKKAFKKSTLLKNTQAYGAESDTSYNFVIDGKAGLPVGTKIIKRANGLVFELPDGRSFELTDWCVTNNSEVVELLNGQVYDQATEKWIDGVDAVASNSCAWVAQNGAVNGFVGASAVAVATEGFSLLHGALGLGLAGGIAAGVGGSGSSSTPQVATATPSVAGLTTATNSGSLADQITTNTKPSLTGKATPGSKIFVTMQSGEVLETVADSSGNWVVNLNNTLPEGQTSYQVTAQAPGGALSAPVSGSIMIDGSAPSTGLANEATAPAKAFTSTNAKLGGANVGPDISINVVLQKINPDGSITEFPVGPVAVNPDGTWAVPASFLAQLADGSYLMKVTATDPAGNVSEGFESFVVDNTASSSPSVALALASDGGAANDGVTNDTKPSLSGSGANPGDIITVVSPTGEVLTAIVAADGTWTVTPQQALPEGGPQNFTVTSTDAAGNVSEPTTLAVTVDTSAPSSFAISVPAGPSISAAEAANNGGVAVQVTLPTDAQVGDIISVSVDGVSAVQYTVTEQDIAAPRTPVSVVVPTAAILASTTGQGEAVVSTVYTDKAGNSTAPVTTTLIIDTEPASAFGVTLPAGDFINASESQADVPVQVSLPPDAAVGDVITVSVDGAAPIVYTVVADDLVAPVGPITILIPSAVITSANTGQGPAAIVTTYADADGNAAPSITTNVTVDTVLPSVLGTVSVLEGPAINAAETASDNGVPVSVTLPAGAAAGDTVTIRVDNGIPVIYTLLPADVVTSGQTISVLIPSANITAAGQGAAAVVTTFTDAAGNSAPSVTTNVTIDTATPSSPTVGVAAGSVINAVETTGGLPVQITLPANAAAGDVITVSIDGGTPVSYTVRDQDIAALGTPISIVIPSSAISAAGQGAAQVVTTYADASGNAPTNVTTDLTIDTDLPSPPGVTIAEGLAINSAEATSGGGMPVNITLPANAAVGDVITVSIDGSTPISHTVTADELTDLAVPITFLVSTAQLTAAGQGNARVTTTYADSAGNSPTDVIDNLTIDTVAPVARTISGINEDVLTTIDLSALEDSSSGYGSGIASVIVRSLPNQGTLYLADGVTTVALNQSLTSAQLSGLKFRSSFNNANATGFDVTATDAAGNSADVTVSLPVNAVADIDALSLSSTATQILPASSTFTRTIFDSTLAMQLTASDTSAVGFSQRTRISTIVGAMETARALSSTNDATEISVGANATMGLNMQKFSGLVYLTAGTYATSSNGVSIDETVVVRLGGKTTLQIENFGEQPTFTNLVVTTAGYYTVDAYWMNLAGPGVLPPIYLAKDGASAVALNATNFNVFRNLADLQARIGATPGASQLTDLQGTSDGVNGYYAPLIQGRGVPGDTIQLQQVTTTAADNTDGSETNVLTLSAIPVGMTVTDGANTFIATASNQSVDVTNWNLATLTVPTALNAAAAIGNFVLTSTSTEASNGNNASTQINIPYEVSVNNRTFAGTNGNDSAIVGANGANRLFGGAGNDSIDGAGGNDMLYGGAGGTLRNGGFEYWNITDSSISGGSAFLYQTLSANTINSSTGDSALGGWVSGGAPTVGGSVQTSIELQATTYTGASNIAGVGRFLLDGSTGSRPEDDLYLSQRVTTMAGQSYTLDVMMNHRGNDADSIDILWGDVVIARIGSDPSHTVTTFHGYLPPTVSVIQGSSGGNPAVLNYSFTVIGSRDDSGTNVGIAVDNLTSSATARQILSVGLKPTIGDGGDTLIGGMGSDILFGQGGNDLLIGGVQGNVSADLGSTDVAVLSFANNNGNDVFQDFQVGVDRVYLVDVADAYIGSSNWNSSGDAAHVSRYPGNPGSADTNSTTNSDNNLTLRDLVYFNDIGTTLTANGQNKQYLSLTGNGSGDVVIHLNTNGGTNGFTNDNMGSITLTGVKFGAGVGEYDSVGDLLGHGGSTRVLWGTTDGFKEPVDTSTFGSQTVQDFDWTNLTNIYGPIIP
jgi:hypothetical protein